MWVIVLVTLFGLGLPDAAQACSRDDAAYFDGFLDASCLTTLTNTTLDTFGGLRLTTTGVPLTTAWDSGSDFDGGISWESLTFPPVGVRSLTTDTSAGSGAPAKLVLPDTVLPLTRDATGILGPEPAAVLDNDNVDDPAVVKVGTTYLMWYSGKAEDGRGPAIFLAESADGETWVRANGGTPVLEGTPDAFDERGVFGPDVITDPNDPAAPFKMWYSGKGDVFGAIGYATSVDGLTWTKHDDTTTPEPTDAILDHGPPGSPDSFAAADPAVLRDGANWKMWYTGDDSNKKRIAYATSLDGIAWTKGGKVISPEDPGSNANYDFGAFAPTVWKTSTGFRMLLSGRKNLGTATDPEFQTRIMNSSSSDGITWSAPSPTLNPQSNRFDASNLNSPDILEDPGSSSPFKLYYAGNAVDANGNFHMRLGLATSTNGTSFSRFNGPVECLRCVLDIGTPGASFDARQASGLSVVAPSGADHVGFYWGTRGSDFKPRLGQATSADASSWTKVGVSMADGGALFPLGSAGAFDQDGHRDPSALYEQNAAGGADDYLLYFTAVSGSARSVGFASAPEEEATKHPDGGGWSARSQVLAPTGSGFEAAGVSHPSIVKDTDYILYYTATSSGGVTSIGRAVAPEASGPDGPFGTRSQVDFISSSACDPDGRKDPVVVKDGVGSFRMLYTGLENLEGRAIERACYATSSNGTTWSPKGVVLNPSQEPYGPDEVGVQPTGLLIDGSTLHVFSSGVDRSGRTRGTHATTPYPTPMAPVPGVPNGWATYQLGDHTTSVRDFRTITRTSTGDTVTLWVSFEQPYSSGGTGNQFWSDFFPVTLDGPSEPLNMLLSVRGVRWQARLSDPSADPALDSVEIAHAPVQFAPNGSATTGDISPPPGQSVASWTSATVSADLFSPGGSGTAAGTVTVLDPTGTQQLATQPLMTNGDTTIDLSVVSATTYQALRIRFDLVSYPPFSATPLIRGLKVLYATGEPPPPPVPRCGGRDATIVGTGGPDVLRGTKKPDVIAALGGKDQVRAVGKGDRVCGGPGNDSLYGGAGKDRLYGGGGKDRLVGGSGTGDLCVGGGGRDRASRTCEKIRSVP